MESFDGRSTILAGPSQETPVEMENVEAEEIPIPVEEYDEIVEVGTIAAQPSYTCMLCEQSFSTKPAYRQHMKIDHGRFQCNHCNMLFTSKKGINSHTCTQPSPVQTARYECPKCSKVFIKRATLERHIKIVHDKETLPKVRDIIYSCDVCGVNIKGLWNLTNHMSRCHIKDSSFVCQQCGRGFHRANELRIHTVIHRAECPHTCQECGLGLNTAEELQQHMHEIHDVSELHPCSVCEEKFTTPKQLEQHERTHNKNFQCSVCNKLFSTQQAAASHLNTHAGDKPYKCDVCPKAFAWRHSLAIHKRWHEGDKRYHCHFCNHTFFQSSALKEHLRSHSGNKLHKCPHCVRAFSSKSSLMCHIRQHSGERPFVCELCPNRVRFTNRHSVVIHMKRLHGQELSAENYTILPSPTLQSEPQNLPKELLQVCDTISSTKQGVSEHTSNVGNDLLVEVAADDSHLQNEMNVQYVDENGKPLELTAEAKLMLDQMTKQAAIDDDGVLYYDADQQQQQQQQQQQPFQEIQQHQEVSSTNISVVEHGDISCSMESMAVATQCSSAIQDSQQFQVITLPNDNNNSNAIQEQNLGSGKNNSDERVVLYIKGEEKKDMSELEEFIKQEQLQNFEVSYENQQQGAVVAGTVIEGSETLVAAESSVVDGQYKAEEMVVAEVEGQYKTEEELVEAVVNGQYTAEGEMVVAEVDGQYKAEEEMVVDTNAKEESEHEDVQICMEASTDEFVASVGALLASLTPEEIDHLKRHTQLPPRVADDLVVAMDVGKNAIVIRSTYDASFESTDIVLGDIDVDAADADSVGSIVQDDTHYGIQNEAANENYQSITEQAVPRDVPATPGYTFHLDSSILPSAQPNPADSLAYLPQQPPQTTGANKNHSSMEYLLQQNQESINQQSLQTNTNHQTSVEYVSQQSLQTSEEYAPQQTAETNMSNTPATVIPNCDDHKAGAADMHLISRNNYVFGCASCDIAYPNGELLKQHKCTERRIGFRCLKCMGIFMSSELLSEHQITHRTPQPCNLCGVLIKDKREHAKACKKAQKIQPSGNHCNCCGTNIDPDEARNHTIKFAKVVTCMTCNLMCLYECALLRHAMNNHSEQDTTFETVDKKKIKVEYNADVVQLVNYGVEVVEFGGKFVMKKGVAEKRKMEVKHVTVTPEDIVGNAQEGDEKVVMEMKKDSGFEILSAEDESDEAMLYEVVTLNNENEEMEDGSRKKRLRRKLPPLNYRVTHDQNKPYGCLHCPVGFLNSSALRNHMTVQHTQEMPYSCELCGERFPEVTKLTVHQRMHKGTPKYRCAECDLLFWTVASLRKHAWKHNTRKPFTCEKCRRGFKDKRTLNRHYTNFGLDVGSYKCRFEECEKAFEFKCQLQWHQVHDHPNRKACREAKKAEKQKYAITESKSKGTQQYIAAVEVIRNPKSKKIRDTLEAIDVWRNEKGVKDKQKPLMVSERVEAMIAWKREQERKLEEKKKAETRKENEEAMDSSEEDATMLDDVAQVECYEEEEASAEGSVSESVATVTSASSQVAPNVQSSKDVVPNVTTTEPNAIVNVPTATLPTATLPTATLPTVTLPTATLPTAPRPAKDEAPEPKVPAGPVATPVLVQPVIHFSLINPTILVNPNVLNQIEQTVLDSGVVTSADKKITITTTEKHTKNAESSTKSTEKRVIYSESVTGKSTKVNYAVQTETPKKVKKKRSEELNECKFCHEIFTTYKGTQFHVCRFGLNPRKCWLCESCFKDMGGLRRHVKEEHGLEIVEEIGAEEISVMDVSEDFEQMSEGEIVPKQGDKKGRKTSGENVSSAAEMGKIKNVPNMSALERGKRIIEALWASKTTDKSERKNEEKEVKIVSNNEEKKVKIVSNNEEKEVKIVSKNRKKQRRKKLSDSEDTDVEYEVDVEVVDVRRSSRKRKPKAFDEFFTEDQIRKKAKTKDTETPVQSETEIGNTDNEIEALPESRSQSGISEIRIDSVVSLAELIESENETESTSEKMVQEKRYSEVLMELSKQEQEEGHSSEEEDIRDVEGEMNSAECHLCFKWCKNMPEFKAHMLEPLGCRVLRTCKWCKQELDSGAELEMHIRDAHAEKKFECIVCRKKFMTVQAKVSHLKSHVHLKLPRYLLPTPVKSPRLLVTGEKFTDMFRFDRTEGATKAATCLLCGKLVWMRAMRKHYEEHNSMCQVILPIWKSSSSPTEQEEPTVTSKERFQCPYCSLSFAMRSRYKSHVERHEGRVEKKFHCMECGKNFQKPSDLRAHCVTHGSEKPHTCEFCNKTFNRISNKNRHMRTHLGLEEVVVVETTDQT